MNEGNAELEEMFKKETKLESHVTMLTIKRTMTCFFAIIFSIPFFINTTYKGYLTEYIPIAKMAVYIQENVGNDAFTQMLDSIVDKHKDDFDKLVAVEGHGYEYKAKNYEEGKIRKLERYSLKTKGIKFTVDLHNTMTLYAI